MNTIKASIIILNYNGKNYIEKCLLSVFNSNYPDIEVIFVDNASSDGSIGYVKQKFNCNTDLRLVINDKNYGFAFGNNIGVRYATGKYLIFLNIDTIVDSNWLMELINVMEANPLIGATQCKILEMDNTKFIDSVGHYMDWFGISYVKGHKEEDHGQYDRIEEIFGATGAALMIRKDVFQKLGGFDNDFFMLFEEDDLCWRIWLAGYKVLYIPKAIVLHKSGTIRSKMGNYFNLYLSRRNRIMSLMKNYSTKNLIRFLPINIILLLLITLFTKNRLEYIKSFSDSISWLGHNLRIIILKRHIVQATRVVSDKQLMAMSIIRKPSIYEMLRKGY